uniref:Protein kinase domain-containing protein n=1 Tax=Ananas comosus var. bracteatus TaxID=296719 RepID=A0A6V7NIJ8_ANACO|nr:unnamed protein product [Ananas comosus var. bracteatus]
MPDELAKLERLQELHISGNNLTGSVPDWVGNLTHLRVFSAYENSLSGVIPKNLGSISQLEVLNLHSNQLRGEIPESIFASGRLQILILTLNGLNGSIPESIGKCKFLSNLRIGNNRLIGPVPPSIGNVGGSLTYFEADNNHLRGEIVPEFAQCSNLTLLNLASLSKLDLSGNKFSGSLPETLCNMSRLQFLLLDHNFLSGEIPPGIGSCGRLLELQMGSNFLSGSIPPEIGRIRNLQITLNLSFNHLRGPLPRELGKLDKLVSLDVSNNQISGEIPAELKEEPPSSFAGNKELCGDPLNSNCGADTNYGADHHKVSYKIILAVVGSGLAVFAAVSVVVGLFMLREKQESDAKATMVAGVVVVAPQIVAGNVFVDSLKQAVDFDSIVKETLRDSNKISNGHLVVIIRQSCRRVCCSRHANLMRPIGYVIYEDVALLLHRHMSNGTLAQLLHEKAATAEYEPDWPRRLSIAVGVAEGLAFLHHIAIIHLDISSGNIFLDSNFSALIGEIEISKLIDPSKGTASISAVAGSFGYIPPEYAYTMQVTVPGNVYSFGVVLLEILTSRLPADEGFGEGIDLVKWVHSASVRGETPEQIMDARLSTVSFAWRTQMLAVLKVALLCTDRAPAKRPKMKKVVEMLLEVKGNQ